MHSLYKRGFVSAGLASEPIELKKMATSRKPEVKLKSKSAGVLKEAPLKRSRVRENAGLIRSAA